MGLTQESLAEQAGFSVDYIKKLEGGTRSASSASVEVLAETLGLEVASVRPSVGALESWRSMTLPFGSFRDRCTGVQSLRGHGS